jgi:hypothetical protein
MVRSPYVPFCMKFALPFGSGLVSSKNEKIKGEG